MSLFQGKVSYFYLITLPLSPIYFMVFLLLKDFQHTTVLFAFCGKTQWVPSKQHICLFTETCWPASWETCMQVRKQLLELDMEQRTASKLGKEYIKAVYCHPAYLTYMQSTSCEMPGWMKHKLESRLLGEMSITSDLQMTPPLWQKVKN